MSKFCMIETAFDNISQVNKVVDTLLEKKLVASTHVIKSDSSWNYKGKKESNEEFLLQMKTKTKNKEVIYEIIKKIHSYECFEFAIYKINSLNAEYLGWLDKEVW